MLTSDPQSEVVKTAERGQVRRGEGSIVHVEVFGDGRVNSHHPKDLGPQTRPRVNYRPTPSTVKSPETCRGRAHQDPEKRRPGHRLAAG